MPRKTGACSVRHRAAETWQAYDVARDTWQATRFMRRRTPGRASRLRPVPGFRCPHWVVPHACMHELAGADPIKRSTNVTLWPYRTLHQPCGGMPRPRHPSVVRLCWGFASLSVELRPLDGMVPVQRRGSGPVLSSGPLRCTWWCGVSSGNADGIFEPWMEFGGYRTLRMRLDGPVRELAGRLRGPCPLIS